MKYICLACGYIYDEESIGVKFSDLPEDWRCPRCGAPKSAFEPVREETETLKESTEQNPDKPGFFRRLFRK